MLEKLGPLKLKLEIERWPLTTPFRIAGHVWEFCEVLVVDLESEGYRGRGEAAGVYYRNDEPLSMRTALELLRRKIEAGVSRDILQTLLPPGGARNALDCALWDLEAKRTGRPAWQIAELDRPGPLLTAMTCGADDPAAMAANALSYSHARAIKLKLTGEATDADRVRAVRAARPDVWLAVDANQSFSRRSLEQLMPILADANVALIEQPFFVGQEGLLDGFNSPIPVAADESVQELSDIAPLVGRFSVVNIKLDKCGGLTEGLAMIRTARACGLDTMVGCMVGTSLALAPAFLLGQLCKIVDLDTPMFLAKDRDPPAQYVDGCISCPQSIWG